MYKKPTFETLFPDIFQEVRRALVQEIPNLHEQKIGAEVEMITRVLVQQNIVVLDDYKSDENKVAIGLFVYFYNMNWRHLCREYGRRQSLLKFLQQVISDYNNTASHPNFAPEIRKRRNQRTSVLKLPGSSQKPEVA